ncbi:MAG: hypothetical protein AAF830_12750 [Pseudomonadota bacterium]
MKFIKGAAFAAAFLALGLSSASAASLTSLVGDKDGFGGAFATDVPDNVDGPTNYNNTSGGDLAFHDVWLFEQNGGIAGSPLEFMHVYDMPMNPVSATFSINVQGMGDGPRVWDVVFNDVVIGQITSPGSRLARLLSFDVAVDLLTGSDMVALVLAVDIGEGYAVNFSELAIETATAPVPLPGALPLLATALAGFSVRQRMRRR